MQKEQSLDVGFVFVDYLDHNLYQLRQWLQPLERLQSHFSVKVFYTSLDVAKELKSSTVTGVHFDGQEDLTKKLYEFAPRVLLYPNQNIRNFYALRYQEAVHAFVSHGESDKAYMAQNTIKRFDLYFAAGQAAIDRISTKVSHFDGVKRILEIGRPQSLDNHLLPDDFVSSDRKRVLYAPTWEGVTRATRYTSIESHGLKLVASLLESGKYQITYRPHPLSGSRDKNIKSADEAIKKLIRQSNKTEANTHYIDQSPFGWHLQYHDLMISDISAIAYDWLSTGHPILLTKPVEKKAIVEDFPLVDKLYSIQEGELASVEKLVAAQFDSGSSHQKISEELNAYYFKQPTNQSDTHLINAIEAAISLKTEQLDHQDFPKLAPYQSRGGALGLLRYPNFVMRETLRLTGAWSLTKKLSSLSQTDEVFVHLSDPFNGKSVVPAISKLFREHQKGGKLVLVVNQVTSLLTVQKLLRNSEFRHLASDVSIVPVANASDCEMVVSKLKPKKAWYLKHHPLNHMLLRLNGTEHGLWRPDLDPLFVPDHSLITYDVVLGANDSTKQYLGKLLKISRPVIVEG